MVHDQFYVAVAEGSVIRVDLPEHADRPEEGAKVTVAVEVYS